MTQSPKTKVAVLGGGAGAIAAAWELTATPELRERFDVTVHQAGWRLGGKGASGRNRARSNRIEEHGLHLWFGFYDNAFDLMRRCYDELGRPRSAPLARWSDAFKPCDTVVLYECFQNRWIARQFDFPQNDDTPGDPRELTFWRIAHLVLRWLNGRWHELSGRHRGAAPAADDWAHRLAREVGADVRHLEDVGVSAMLSVAHELARVRDAAPERLAGARAGEHGRLLCRLLQGFRGWLWKHVVEPHLDDDELRFFFMALDCSAATLCGIVADDLVARGFGAANDEELCEWLGRHGCTQVTRESAPFLRAFYDLVFGFEGGDVARRNVAAGASLSAMLRIVFDYKGAILWKMQAGMGDVVFAPLWQVLRQRGVRFEFFHWVTRLTPSANGRSVAEVEYVQQVELAHDEYMPLFDANGLPCWPSEPDWSQIVDPDRVRGIDLEQVANPRAVEPSVLRAGSDFDRVVLGIPVGAQPPIVAELLAGGQGSKLRQMLDHSSTVMTQAFQIWLTRDLAALGWTRPADSVASSYVEPLDTWCDMSHLLRRESWPPDVRDISYFCGVLADRPGDTQALATARARAAALAFLRSATGELWPRATSQTGELDWELLVAADGVHGAARFDSQYWRANFSGSERYVLTPAGSVRYRLRPGDSGYENLFLAGDWTRNDIDGGSVEGAITSGILAGRAIAGDPRPARGTTGLLSAKGDP